MTIKELITQLENAAYELGDDAEVRTKSETHCCSLHHIEDVEVGEYDAFINITTD